MYILESADALRASWILFAQPFADHAQRLKQICLSNTSADLSTQLSSPEDSSRGFRNAPRKMHQASSSPLQCN